MLFDPFTVLPGYQKQMYTLWEVPVNGGNGKERYGDDYADIYAIARLHFKAAMSKTCDHVSRKDVFAPPQKQKCHAFLEPKLSRYRDRGCALDAYNKKFQRKSSLVPRRCMWHLGSRGSNQKGVRVFGLVSCSSYRGGGGGGVS